MQFENLPAAPACACFLVPMGVESLVLARCICENGAAGEEGEDG